GIDLGAFVSFCECHRLTFPLRLLHVPASPGSACERLPECPVPELALQHRTLQLVTAAYCRVFTRNGAGSAASGSNRPVRSRSYPSPRRTPPRGPSGS